MRYVADLLWREAVILYYIGVSNGASYRDALTCGTDWISRWILGPVCQRINQVN
jgi:hypothetical protein